MLKWIREKLTNVDGTVSEFAHEIQSMYRSIQEANPHLSLDELYSATVMQFLDKRYDGDADLTIATEMIMSGASDAARFKDEPLRLQHVATNAIGTYIGYRRNKAPSDLFALSIWHAVCEVIPDYL